MISDCNQHSTAVSVLSIISANIERFVTIEQFTVLYSPGKSRFGKHSDISIGGIYNGT